MRKVNFMNDLSLRCNRDFDSNVIILIIVNTINLLLLGNQISSLYS